MSTELLTAVIVAGLLLAIILLAMASNRDKKITKRRMMKAFYLFVKEHLLTLYKEQTLHRNMIGIDRKNARLIFLHTTPAGPEFSLIDLQELESCRVIREQNASGQISTISLQCIFKDQRKPPVLLPFYNEKKDPLYKKIRLSNKASYWEKTINLFRDPVILTGNESFVTI